MASIREFKYKLVKKFLTSDEVEFFKIYVNEAIKGSWDIDTQQSILQPSWYKDPCMNTLLKKKLPLMEKVTGLKLYETYAFWRYYVWGAELPDHTDRPSCEISVTVNLDDDGKSWPIHMEDNYLHLRPGDAVAYLGCQLRHGRKKYEGDYNAQVFLHYVDQNGPYANYAGDNITSEDLLTNDKKDLIQQHNEKIQEKLK